MRERAAVKARRLALIRRIGALDLDVDWTVPSPRSERVVLSLRVAEALVKLAEQAREEGTS